MLFSIPGVENLSQTTVTIVALVLALVLVAFFGLILRRLTSGRLSLKTDRGRARQPRLGIVDVYDLDRQRQLILLRRDNVEHLLLVGGPNDVVVETNIVRAGGSRLPVVPADAQDRADQAERSVEIAPVRPVLEATGMRLPEPVAARLGAADATARGAIEPALKPSSVSAAPASRTTERVARPNGGAAPSGQTGAETRAMSGAGQAAPRPASVTVETGRPDMAKQLEEALARPAPEPRPTPPRTLEMPRATPVAQPGRMASMFRRVEPASAPVPEPVVPVAPEPEIPAVSREPEIAAEPLPPMAAGAPQADRVAEPAAKPDAAPEQGENPLDVKPRDELPKDESRPGEADAERRESEPSVLLAPDEPALAFAAPVVEERKTVPEPARPAATPVPRPAAPPSPSPGAGRNDPFSIEDIEAEFARLLGRPVEKRDDRT